MLLFLTPTMRWNSWRGGRCSKISFYKTWLLSFLKMCFGHTSYRMYDQQLALQFAWSGFYWEPTRHAALSRFNMEVDSTSQNGGCRIWSKITPSSEEPSQGAWSLLGIMHTPLLPGNTRPTTPVTKREFCMAASCKTMPASCSLVDALNLMAVSSVPFQLLRWKCVSSVHTYTH